MDTARTNDLLILGEEVMGVDYDHEKAVIYSLPILLHSPFPYKMMRVGEGGPPVAEWTRKFRDPNTGNEVSYSMVSLGPGRIPLPFGLFDRALFSWVLTKAHLQRSPVVSFDSPVEFLKKFGFGVTGMGYKRFRESWERLGNVVMTVELRDGTFVKHKNIRVFKEWLAPQTKEESELKRISIYNMCFDDEFFEMATRVPLNLDICMSGMKRRRDKAEWWDFSGLAQACSFRATKKRAPFDIDCDQLIAASGTRDSDPYRVKGTFRKAAEEFCTAFPHYRIEFVGKKIIFYPLDDLESLVTPPRKELPQRMPPMTDQPELAFGDYEDQPEKPRYARRQKPQPDPKLDWSAEFKRHKEVHAMVWDQYTFLSTLNGANEVHRFGEEEKRWQEGIVNQCLEYGRRLMAEENWRKEKNRKENARLAAKRHREKKKLQRQVGQ